MSTKRKRHYKETIRDRIISLRLTAEEWHQLRARSCRHCRSAAALIRARIDDLIGTEGQEIPPPRAHGEIVNKD